MAKHEHGCIKNTPKCLCNTCKHDGNLKDGVCCGLHQPYCGGLGITGCSDYEKETADKIIEDSNYKKAHVRLFNRTTDALESLLRLYRDTEPSDTRVEIFSIYCDLIEAQIEAERIIIGGPESDD